MSDDQKQPAPKGPVRRLFQDVMSHSAHQGWMIGHMDSAVASLEIVRDDARENLKRAPNHKLSADAERLLTKAINDINGIAARLQSAAAGENRYG